MYMHRATISFILLMCYSLGITHNLVPHCLSGEADDHIEEQGVTHHHHAHHFHDHEVPVQRSASHIQHKDHCDTDIYDFFICLLTELEHPATSCETLQCLLQNPIKRSVKEPISVNCSGADSSYELLTRPVMRTGLMHEADVAFNTRHHTSDNPLRGPPVISS
jgi:hypothetical protein